mgnify:FL=1
MIRIVVDGAPVAKGRKYNAYRALTLAKWLEAEAIALSQLGIDDNLRECAKMLRAAVTEISALNGEKNPNDPDHR